MHYIIPYCRFLLKKKVEEHCLKLGLNSAHIRTLELSFINHSVICLSQTRNMRIPELIQPLAKNGRAPVFCKHQQTSALPSPSHLPHLHIHTSPSLSPSLPPQHWFIPTCTDPLWDIHPPLWNLGSHHDSTDPLPWITLILHIVCRVPAGRGCEHRWERGPVIASICRLSPLLSLSFFFLFFFWLLSLHLSSSFCFSPQAEWPGRDRLVLPGSIPTSNGTTEMRMSICQYFSGLCHVVQI